MLYAPSDKIKEIGERVLKEERYKYIVDADIRIGYMIADDDKTVKNKTRYADCTKVADLYKALVPYDFLITFYPSAQELDIVHQERVMRHELMHIGIKSDGKLYIEPHDVEDFREMIARYGVGWVRD